MKENYVLNFLKGILIGIANAVPGVSGGTIAFITGIYERLVIGIKDVGVFIKEFLLKIFNRNKKSFRKIFGIIDFKFFIPLLLGILPAIYFFSVLFSGLLENGKAFVFSFFIGLIIASIFVIYRKIEKKTLVGFIIGILGIVVGFIISILPLSSESAIPNFFTILVIGAIASVTMILPGISGAFVVLVFGKLDFMYKAVANFEWNYLIPFGLGAIIGLLAFAKFLSFLLKKYHSYTLFALTGIMIGALFGPVKNTIMEISGTLSIALAVVLLAIGAVAVFVLEKFSNN